jgi:hypothetical protein
MGIGVKLTMNGKPFNGSDFKKQLEQDVLKKAREHVRKKVEAKLRDVHCPDHPVAGTVRVDMPDLKGGKIAVTPCCEKVAKQVAAIVGGAEGDAGSE